MLKQEKKEENNMVLSTLQTTTGVAIAGGATVAANCLSGLSAQAAEINDTKAYIESLSDEELARLCDLGDQELTSSPKILTK